MPGVLRADSRWWRTLAVPLAVVAVLAGAPARAAEWPAPEHFPTDLPPRPAWQDSADSGCVLPDPTGTGGCVTEATADLLVAVEEAFGGLPVSCWDEHAWNPRSDHPRGRACDYTIGRIGRQPSDAQVEQGWLLATWLRANARRLDVRYVIWQGEIWVRGQDEWREYTGGGVYDPDDVTGGHYDHVHVSTRK